MFIPQPQDNPPAPSPKEFYRRRQVRALLEFLEPAWEPSRWSTWRETRAPGAAARSGRLPPIAEELDTQETPDKPSGPSAAPPRLFIPALPAVVPRVTLLSLKTLPDEVRTKLALPRLRPIYFLSATGA